MRFRKLRTAWSVVCGVACLLLMVLWVRSYWRYQRVYFKVSIGEYSHSIVFRSYGNRLRTQYRSESNKRPQTRWFDCQTENSPVDKWFSIDRSRKYTLGFSHQWVDRGIDTVIPHWFAMCTCIALASASWLRWRFSLHTLLLTTTLVAVVLGLIVWLR
jgi:hypothetical protein